MKQINIKLNKELFNLLKKHVKKEGRTVSSYVRWIISKELKNNNNNG